MKLLLLFPMLVAATHLPTSQACFNKMTWNVNPLPLLPQGQGFWDEEENPRNIVKSCECGTGGNERVFISWTSEKPTSTKKTCLGIIVTSNMVATSHKCMRLNGTQIQPYNGWWSSRPKYTKYDSVFPPPSDIVVSSPLLLSEDYFRVERLIINPNFALYAPVVDNSFSGNDLLLLVLKAADFTERNATLRPICVPAGDPAQDLTGLMGLIVGVNESDSDIYSTPAFSIYKADIPGAGVRFGRDCSDRKASWVSTLDRKVDRELCVCYYTEDADEVPKEQGSALISIAEPHFLLGIVTNVSSWSGGGFLHLANIFPLVKYLEHHAKEAESKWCSSPRKFYPGEKVSRETLCGRPSPSLPPPFNLPGFIPPEFNPPGFYPPIFNPPVFNPPDFQLPPPFHPPPPFNPPPPFHPPPPFTPPPPFNPPPSFHPPPFHPPPSPPPPFFPPSGPPPPSHPSPSVPPPSPPPPRDISLDCECGKLNSGSMRQKTSSASVMIIGGETAAPREFGWMVKLGIAKKGKDGNGSYFLCGGSLVNDRMILSAAHCFTWFDEADRRKYSVAPPENASVYLNAHELVDDPREREVVLKAVYVHDGYIEGGKRGQTLDDIAILVLRRPLRFVPSTGGNNNGLRPVCLPKFDDNPNWIGKTGTVAGWGNTRLKDDDDDDDESRLAERLQKLNVPINDMSVCRRAASSPGKNFDGFLCAGTLDPNKDSAGGDSGGPLMVKNDKTSKYDLAGIVSHGVRKGNIAAGFYTDVHKKVHWVDNYASQVGAKWCKS